jgi:hypothetical protein
MSAPSYSDSPANPTNYLGQNYRFTPTYIRSRNPTVLDTKPKENQGFYPIGSIWINTSTPPEIWILARIFSNNAAVNAEWVLIANSLNTGPLLTLSDTAGIVVPPSSDVSNPPGNIQLVGGSGITIVGTPASNLITITNTGAGSADTLTGDDGVIVSPIAGTIRTLGNTVANATFAKALFTNNPSSNIEQFNIQVATTLASTDPTLVKVGLAVFSSAQFAVDANGFVTLAGGSTPPTLGLTPDAHTAPGTSPVIPNGSGDIIIEGGTTFATGTQAKPIRTNSLAANTIDLQIQLAGSNAAVSTPNDFGVSQFDSNSFGVTSGFVTLNNAGTTGAITKVNLDAGTTPILPTAGAITLTGAQVAAGTTTNVIRTDGTGASTGAIQIQRSQAVASSTIGDNGVSHFNSANFTVDGNGFVSLAAGPTFGIIPDAISGSGTSPVVPNGSGNIILTGGATYSTGSRANPIEVVSTAANTAALQIQLAGSNPTVAAPNDFGVAQFNSTNFTSTAGFVTSNNFTINTSGGLTGGGSITLGGTLNLVGTSTTFPWTDQSVSFSAVVSNGYFVTATATATLPASPAQGNTISFAVDSVSGILTIQANTGQEIRIGKAVSALAGVALSNFDGDSVTLVFRASDSTWIATSSVGTWSVT